MNNINEMDLPVYKLVINEEDDTGVEFVSLVTNPAIERDFQYFNEQFVKPKSGESESDFIGRCIQVVKGEGYDDKQAAAICYSYWKGEFESYTDYPESASNNAKRALEWADKNGWGDCGTPVGKRRANQLAKKEPITRETIARMAAFRRHQQHKDVPYSEGCGGLMWDAWGGESGISWAENKLEKIDMEDVSGLPDYVTEGLPLFDTKEEAEAYAKKIGCTGSHKMGEKWMPCSAEQAHPEQKFSIQDEEKRIITGAAMIADKPIYRFDNLRGEYYVVFDKETIWQIAKKWAKSDRYDSVNIHHEDPTAGLSLLESYIVDREMGKYPPKGYDEVADGSWFLSYIVNDDNIWQRVKDGEFKGFSVEGFFDFQEDQDEVMLSKIRQVLKQWDGKN